MKSDNEYVFFCGGGQVDLYILFYMLLITGNYRPEPAAVHSFFM